jgi:SAM-dependent methyltransferase
VVTQYYLSRIMTAAIRGLATIDLFPLDERSVLDIGCGEGNWLLEFSQWGAAARDLHGVDLDRHRLSKARLKLPAADLHCGSAGQLPWPAASFDLVSQFTVFTSVLQPQLRNSMAQEMLRVLKPAGAILWYDFRVNNPQNPNVRGIGAGEIRSLFSGCDVRLLSITLAPPLARIVVPFSWMAALMLEKLPFLRTHYFGIIRKL